MIRFGIFVATLYLMNFQSFLKSLIITACILFTANNSYSQKVADLNRDDCACSTETEKSKRYIPPLNILLKFENFSKSTLWELENGESDFNKLYFDKITTNSSTFSGNKLNTTILSSEPIRLIHPNKTFSINITPCNNANKYYDIKTYFGSNTRNQYDFDDFDYTAEAYFSFMKTITGYHNYEDVLRAFWLKKYEYNSENFLSLINDLNETYDLNVESKLSIDDYEGFIENLEEKTNEIIEKLLTKESNLNAFILRRYIITDTAYHKINGEEEKNIATFFHDYHSEDFSINWVEENYLRGKYSGVFHTKKIGFEVNSKIIKNELSNTITSILLGINKLSYSNTGSLSINTQEVCQKNYEISNTGIKMMLKDVTLTAPSKNEIRQKAKRTRSNTIDFSGLLIHDATLQIPYKSRNIKAVGNNLRLNNNLISGSFIIYKNTTDLALEKLQKHLTKLGLNEVSVTEDSELYTISFNNVSQNK